MHLFRLQDIFFRIDFLVLLAPSISTWGRFRRSWTWHPSVSSKLWATWPWAWLPRTGPTAAATTWLWLPATSASTVGTPNWAYDGRPSSTTTAIWARSPTAISSTAFCRTRTLATWAWAAPASWRTYWCTLLLLLLAPAPTWGPWTPTSSSQSCKKSGKKSRTSASTSSPAVACQDGSYYHAEK